MRLSSLLTSFVAMTPIALVALVSLAGCAADKSPPRSAADAPAAEARPVAPSYQQPGYPPSSSPAGIQPQPGVPGVAPPPPPQADDSSSSSYATPPNRAAALSQAHNEVESSQRELDVAGGSCSNACRALGSMDRATGRLCGLAQSNDEVRRCGDAKTRVYSARDKVKNTCGSCPDTSVDRTAPIPSK